MFPALYLLPLLPAIFDEEFWFPVVCVCAQSYLTLVTPWIVARQVPPSIDFSRQEYWGGLPCRPPRDLPDSGLKPKSLVSPSLAGGFFTTAPFRKPSPLEVVI